MRLVVRPSRELRGTVRVPGDKSISHRALMLGAIAEGMTQVTNWLPAGDCQATLRCLRALGVPIEQHDATTLTVHGVGRDGMRSSQATLDCRGSGTTMRLLAGILAGQPFTSTLDGHDGLRQRPMRRIIDPLRQMGAEVEGRDGRFPPLRVQGGKLRGIDYRLPVASAQVKSCILLAGLFADGPTTLHESGPARDHTERMLRAMGADLQINGRTITLVPGPAPLNPITLQVPGDVSSAAFLLVAGAVVPGSRILIEDVGGNPTRTGLLEVLRAMGVRIDIEDQGTSGGEPLIDLAVRHSVPSSGPPPRRRPRRSGHGLHGAEVEGSLVVRMIDEFPILAVAATQAEGATVVRDAEELRVKETDRIAAVATELRKMGAEIEENHDGFVVYGPAALRGTTVHSLGDHRLAMALAVAGLVAEGETVIEGAEVISDSYPGFVETLQGLGASIEFL